MLILLVGLLTTTLASVYLLSRERIDLMRQVNGFSFMYDIARVVSLLDVVAPERRSKVLDTFGSGFLRTRISSQPPQIETSHEPLDEARKAALSMALERALGDQRPFSLAIEMDIFDMVLNVSAALRDGTWVSFEHRIPHELVGWPRRVLVTLVLLIGSVVILSLMAVRWVTLPLSMLSRAAQTLGRDLKGPPLTEAGPIEAVRATRAFNQMQQQIQRHLGERTRILAAISHDLKTPITRLRLRSELISDPDLRERHLHDLEEIEKMISATIDFMHGNYSNETRSVIDLPALLESLCNDAEEMGWDVSITACPIDRLVAQPMAIKRCLGNLISNAVRYRGRARIRVESRPDATRLIVSDDGPGLPEGELEKVFEPFYRLDTSRNRGTGGSGLGLSIARNIARDHGGELMLYNRDGGGLDAVIELPAR